jgi:hypothetical protein
MKNNSHPETSTMRNGIVACFAVVVLAACADAPTAAPVPAGQSANRTWNEAESFETVEDALAAAQAASVLPDAIASAGWVDWSGSVKTYGYFQYLNANYIVGDARVATMLGSYTERDSQWQRATDSRAITGGRFLDPWPAFRKDVSVPLTRNCGLQAHVQAKMDAQFFALVRWAPVVIAHKEDTDSQWSEQGACAVTQYAQVGGGAGGDCGWFIVQVQDYAGTWYNVGEPFEVCGDWQSYTTAKRKRSSFLPGEPDGMKSSDRIAPSKSSESESSKRVSVRFRAASQLEEAAVGFVQSDNAGAAALVVVDTNRATAEDLESTLLAVRHYLDLNRRDVRIPIYKNDLGSAARERAKGASTSLLRSLRAPRNQARPNSGLLAEVALPSIVVQTKR